MTTKEILENRFNELMSVKNGIIGDYKGFFTEFAKMNFGEEYFCSCLSDNRMEFGFDSDSCFYHLEFFIDKYKDFEHTVKGTTVKLSVSSCGSFDLSDVNDDRYKYYKLVMFSMQYKDAIIKHIDEMMMKLEPVVNEICVCENELITIDMEERKVAYQAEIDKMNNEMKEFISTADPEKYVTILSENPKSQVTYRKKPVKILLIAYDKEWPSIADVEYCRRRHSNNITLDSKRVQIKKLKIAA